MDRQSRPCQPVEIGQLVRFREALLVALERRDMERFVQYVTVGGVVVVAGLWLMALFAPGSPLWLLGIVLTILGGGGLTFGIGSEIGGVSVSS